MKKSAILGVVTALASVGCSLHQASQSQGRVVASKGETSVSLARVTAAADQGVRNLLDRQAHDYFGDYWVMPTRLGLHFTSQYYVLLKLLNRKQSQLDPGKLKKFLLTEQLEDGSWYQVRDPNLPSEEMGNLDATIFDYWALKVLRSEFPLESAAISASMERAKNYILLHGGLSHAAMFTKVFLALSGNCAWSAISYTPLLLFRRSLSPLVVNQFSQWVIPHLKPLAYMRQHKLIKRLGPSHDLSELYAAGKAPRPDHESPNDGLSNSFDSLLGDSKYLEENIILQQQLPRGSWGGYTLATLFSIISLQDYSSRYQNHLSAEKHTEIQAAIEKGFHFVETLYFDSGASSYHGVLDDSSYWDTALALRGLLAVGYNKDALKAPANFLVRQQQSDGGFPFGYDFWPYGDVDDTAEIAIALRQMPAFTAAAERAESFIASRQNRDFGWGTFDKNNTGNFLLRLASTQVSDSAAPFDVSSPDVTGHALESLAMGGARLKGARNIHRAIEYLRRSKEIGVAAWGSRWAVNTIFGTTAVIGGLSRVGLPTSDPLIRDSVEWLNSVQNADGGFGESVKSYIDPSWRGKGISTASQTAWALTAYVDGGAGDSPQANAAALFLVQQMEGSGAWNDPSPVGTGHPGILYMEYPSYPYTFPLMALGKFIQSRCQGAMDAASAEICQKYGAAGK